MFELTFLELLGYKKFVKYKDSFPVDTFSSLKKVCSQCFDFKGLQSELSVNYKNPEFGKINVSSILSHLIQNELADHMEGIEKKCFLQRLNEKPEIFMYCSPITALILKQSFLADVSNKIIALPVGPENLVALPVDCAKPLTVSLIPAGHCPGSVMFLFEWHNKNILYTGDFRIMVGDLKQMAQFHNIYGQVKQISKIYLDTTFLAVEGSKKYFPSRKESALEVCRLIREWLCKGPSHIVNLVTAARYGSEYLFLEIANALNTRIHIPFYNFKVYRAIPDIAWALTDNPRARIHACLQREKKDSKKKVFPLRCLNFHTQPKVLTIKPSVLWWCHNQQKELTSSYSMGEYCKVMYSCHSSTIEIKSMIQYLKPDRIEPCVVPDGKKYEDIKKICSSMLKECCHNLPAMPLTVGLPWHSSEVNEEQTYQFLLSTKKRPKFTVPVEDNRESMVTDTSCDFHTSSPVYLEC